MAHCVFCFDQFHGFLLLYKKSTLCFWKGGFSVHQKHLVFVIAKNRFFYVCSFSNNGMQKRFRRCLATDQKFSWTLDVCGLISWNPWQPVSFDWLDFLDNSTSEPFYYFVTVLYSLDDFGIFRNRDLPLLPVFLQFFILLRRIDIPKTPLISLRHFHIMNL